MHYFSGKGCSEFLEIMHYCIGILNVVGRGKLLADRGRNLKTYSIEISDPAE